MEAVMTLPAGAKPKSKKGAVVAAVGGALTLVGGYFVFFYKDKNGNTLWKKWTGKADEENPIEKVDTPTDAPPAGVAWVAENPSNPFPLKKGMFGGYTKNLQKALGLKDDGKFGSGTEAKVKAKWGKVTVDKANYDSVVNPKASGGGSNFSNLVAALGAAGRNDKDGVWTILQGQNKNYTFKFWTNGRMGVKPVNTQNWKMGSYADGGKKMFIDKGGEFSRTQYPTLNMVDIVKWMDAGAKPSISSEVPYWANK